MSTDADAINLWLKRDPKALIFRENVSSEPAVFCEHIPPEDHDKLKEFRTNVEVNEPFSTYFRDTLKTSEPLLRPMTWKTILLVYSGSCDKTELHNGKYPT